MIKIREIDGRVRTVREPAKGDLCRSRLDGERARVKDVSPGGYLVTLEVQEGVVWSEINPITYFEFASQWDLDPPRRGARTKKPTKVASGGGGASLKSLANASIALQRARNDRAMSHSGKPIVISKAPKGRGYVLHVNGVPIVTEPGGGLNWPETPPGMKKREKLAPAGSPVHIFPKLEDAKFLAHKVGHYMLHLGDMVFAYTELPPGSKW